MVEGNTTTLRVSEIFYSLQGEGARAGEASIFIRLQGCSAKHACFKSGVNCDTEFESGKEMTLNDIFYEASLAISRECPKIAPDLPGEPERSRFLWIVWTGGEPLDQLTPEVVAYVSKLGYKQAIETSGIRKLSQEMANFIDHIALSPKVAEHILTKNFGETLARSLEEENQPNVHELRYVRHAGQPGVPQPSLKAKYYYLSPHSDGGEINRENLEHCIQLCLENPRWRLSVQQHKLWRML